MLRCRKDFSLESGLAFINWLLLKEQIPYHHHDVPRGRLGHGVHVELILSATSLGDKRGEAYLDLRSPIVVATQERPK